MLSKRQWLIVTLIAEESLSWQEVASVTGLHPSTIRAHAKRVTERLKLQHCTPRDAMIHAYYRVRDNSDA